VETPDRIATLSKTPTSAQLRTKPDRKSWSANDVLTYLRACSGVWGEDIDGMLEQDTPKLTHVSQYIWLQNLDYPESKFLVS
jgi:hypothetical protein